MELKIVSKSCVIVSGGTAGHILPSKEIAKQLREKSYHIHWVGYGDKIEYLSESHLVTYHQVRARSPRARYFLSRTYFHDIKRDFSTLISLFKKGNIDFVLLTGNFIGCLPGLLAKWYQIPLYLYEQNTLLGQAHRLFYPFCKKVFWGMPPRFLLTKKDYFTGQPLREEVIRLKNKQLLSDQKKKTVFIFGGSLGADFFNTTLIDLLSSDVSFQKFHFIHSVGSRGDVEKVQKAYLTKDLNGLVLGYIENIAAMYEKADFIISRAGALSLSEIIYLGKKALIIPMPNSVLNHQEYNALSCQNDRLMVKNQKQLTTKDLKDFFTHRDLLTPQEKIAQLCLDS
jgi:UDP-N-acetylglucosamine--N-acetylmuramyl-(pentapeptide) pyrophosphoryl-undecaprenol N-acetylglucosamine transferase